MWNGRYWAADETGESDRAALETARVRQMAAMLIQDSDLRKEHVDWALHTESTYSRHAMLTSAQSIEQLATTASDYDGDPFLLTVGNGTLDLRTGGLRDFRPGVGGARLPGMAAFGIGYGIRSKGRHIGLSP